MNQVYKLLFLCISLCSSFFLGAQQYTPENTGSNPIQSSYMFDILGDSSGDIWMCTGQGLTKYDGTNYTNYTSADGLIQGRITVAFEDAAGNLWFGSGAGVSKYDGSTFMNYTTVDGLIYNRISSIFQDSNGDMWFGTLSDWQGNLGGISKFDGSTWTNYNTGTGLPHNEIHGITQAGTDMWFGTKSGLAKFDGTNWTTYTTMDGLVDDKINTIAVDNSNNIWIGTDLGVSKYDGSSFTTFTTANGLTNDKINDILVDGSDIYFGTANGISKYDGTNWTASATPPLPTSSIICLTKDNVGNSWSGTDMGAAKYDGTNWTIHNTDDGGMISAGSYCIIVDDAGDLWTSGFAGVSRFDGTTWTAYNKSDGLNNNYYWSMLKDNAGNIWLQNTTGDDVVKYDGNTFTTIPLPGRFEECSYLASNGDLWFGSFGDNSGGSGAIRYDGTTWTVYSDSMINNGQVYSIADDTAGIMYFATNNGVITYDGSSYSAFSVLPTGEYITEIFKDSQNNLWFTGYNKYYKYDGANLTTYTHNVDSIASGYCQDIVEDMTGKIYFGTGKFVDIYDAGVWSNLGVADGLPDGNIFSLGMEASGGLWVGYSGGAGIYGHGVTVDNDDITKKFNSISLFPNPSSGQFQLKNMEKIVDVEISNIQGQIIWEKHFENTNVIDIDLSNQINGIYFVTAKSNNGVQTIKLVKE